ncbi:MAG: SDR family NAD(P)-dependent oxidoreductase, partial [Rhizobiales bacterium]|nr:SDR family NAD(P)-dependent oxidoreductase [Hyphomicrobiales bacterium]
YGLALVARNEGELNRVKGVISARHEVPVYVLPLDLGLPDSPAILQAALDENELAPDILINNAGFGLAGNAVDLSRDEQLRMIDLNVRALTDLTLRFLPGMISRRGGGVINIASVAGFMPGPGMAIYFATKAYVLSFSEALSAELRGTGVTVTSLCPGPVETGFQRRAGMRTERFSGPVKPWSPAQVAAAGWAAFSKGARMVVPGWSNKLAAYGSRVTPRRVLLPIIRRATGNAKA